MACICTQVALTAWRLLVDGKVLFDCCVGFENVSVFWLRSTQVALTARMLVMDGKVWFALWLRTWRLRSGMACTCTQVALTAWRLLMEGKDCCVGFENVSVLWLRSTQVALTTGKWHFTGQRKNKELSLHYDEETKEKEVSQYGKLVAG